MLACLLGSIGFAVACSNGGVSTLSESLDHGSHSLEIVAYRGDFPGGGIPWTTELQLDLEERASASTEGLVDPSPFAVEPLSEEKAVLLFAKVPKLNARSFSNEPSLPVARRDPPPFESIKAVTFPPEEQFAFSGELPDHALQVVRYSPSQDVERANHVSLTFSKPMVPLTSQAELAALELPVTMNPEVPGTWSWVGTRTLMFRAEGRLPGATKYQIEVPAGISSTGAEKLDFPFRWEFSTAPLSLVRSYPGEVPQPLRPFIALEFNQAVDASRLKPFLSVRSGGNELEFAILKQSLFEFPEEIERFLASASAERTVVLRPLQNADPATTITVELGAGAPSNEGPLPSKERQLFSFRTFGGLKMAGQNCAAEDRDAYDCDPGEPFYVFFNHNLDTDSITADQVSLTPPLANGKLTVFPWGELSVSGQSVPNTLYTLTLQPGLQDEFGQTFANPLVITFKVGRARPWLPNPGSMKVLPAAANGVYTIHARNLKRTRLQIYRVLPEDWEEYLNVRENLLQWPLSQWPLRQPILFGTAPVFNDLLDFEVSAGGWSRHDLDLTPFLEEGRGHLVMLLKPLRPLFNWESFVPTRAVWVQATDINLEAFADNGIVVVRASRMESGMPSQGVSLTLHPQGGRQDTDASGHAFFAGGESPDGVLGPSYIEARLGEDVAFLPRSTYYSDNTFWRRRWGPDPFRWHLFTDRHLYKTNEKVHVKGWVRHVNMDPEGDVEFTGKADAELHFVARDSRGNEIGAGTASLNQRESIDFSFLIPQDANSGYGQICLLAPVNWGSPTYGPDLACTEINIQEFRRPEFELALTSDGGNHFLGMPIPLELQAKYYGGGPLASSEVTWEISGNLTQYAPPGWDEYAFGGVSVDPWTYYEFERLGYGEEIGSRAFLKGTSTVQGTHGIEATMSASGSPVTHMLSVNATVQDVTQQTQTISDQLLIHPSNQYVGVKTESYLLTAGNPETVSLVVVDVSGRALAGKDVEVQALLRQEPGLGVLPLDGEMVSEAGCQVSSLLQPVSCEIILTEPGLWDFRVSTIDELGRENVTLVQRYAIGKERPIRQEEYNSIVDLVSDQDTYSPGDTARILLQPPFLPAYGTLFINRGGILTHESLEITESQYLLEIPIEESHVPNLTVSAYLTGPASLEGKSGQLPIRAAQGNLDLNVSTSSRELNLDLKFLETEFTPGGTAEIEVLVTDQAGKPVANAEIVLLAVDEATLSLAGYQYSNPIQTFYNHRYAVLSSYQLIDSLLPIGDLAATEVGGGFGRGGGEEAESMVMEMGMAAAPAAVATLAMADDSAMAEKEFSRSVQNQGELGTEPPAVRRDFSPLAVFEPAGSTDSEGRFVASWTLPDLVGQYRVVSLATQGPRLYGIEEASLVARLPLQIRSQLPRFLNFGDSAQLQLIVENQSLTDQEVTLLLQSNSLKLAYEREGLEFDAVTFNVPAQSRRLVARPANADRVGPQQLLASVFNEEYQDHLQVEFPVFTPAAKEGFATYGTVEDKVSLQSFRWPDNVYPDFGALEIGISTTLLQSLADGYLDIRAQSWLSTEILASRILSSSVLREVLPEFGIPDLPSVREIEESVQADIDVVQGYQNPDGGFPLWQSSRLHLESWPFSSVYALHALALARTAGYDVNEQVLDNGLDYLANIGRKFPPYYSQGTRDLIESYALYVRGLQQDVDVPAALRILNGRDWLEHSPDTLAWTIQVLGMSPGNEEEIRRSWEFLLNRVDETAGKATFASGYREEEGHLVLSSNKRSSALLLQALIDTQPEADLMTKLVAGLLAERRRGHWGSTQSNVFVILAMHDYYRKFEEIEPNFHGRAWLDDTLVYNQEFSGRSLATKQARLPNSWLAAEKPETILLQRDGEGLMYYRLGFTYVPANLLLDPVEQGFAVVRSFRGLDSPDDVRQDQDGIWHIELGARVAIKVTMVAVGPRYHVSLVSPVPAGLELINPVLEGTASVSDPFAGLQRWYYGPWYDHQQLLDERAQAIATYLPGGVYEYDIVARATTAGTFLVPPAAAAEIYSPETFGHGATDRVIVGSSD